MVRQVVVALLLLNVSLARADEFAMDHVTVYGTATLQVPPNQMKWQLRVRNVNPTSAAVAEEHGDLLASVLAFLEQNQVSEETIQTSGIQLGENWNSNSGARKRDGYFASTNVSFALVDFTKYASIWIGLSELPGVSVSNVDLEHTERIRFQNEARIKAVQAARDKAHSIAEALDVQLGAPLLVDEDLSVSEGWSSRSPIATNASYTEGEPADVEEYLAPGSIPIRARVRAVFRLSTQP